MLRMDKVGDTTNAEGVSGGVGGEEASTTLARCYCYHPGLGPSCSLALRHHKMLLCDERVCGFLIRF